MMQKTNTVLFKGLAFLLLAQFMVGVNIVSSKYLLLTLPFFLVLTIRFTLATCLTFPLYYFTRSEKRGLKDIFSQLTRRDWIFLTAQSLSAGVIFNLFMLSGLSHTDANIAGIITSALPAIITLMSWYFLGEKLSLKMSYCIFLATIGLIFIAFDKFKGMDGAHSFLGDALIFLALLPEAFYYLLSKVYSSSMPILLLSSFLNGMNALLLLLWIPFVSWHSFHLTGVHSLVLVILGLSSGLFYVFWAAGSKHVDGMLTALSTAMMPLSTVILAWIFLSEHLSFAQTVGMGCVMCSILIYAKR